MNLLSKAAVALAAAAVVVTPTVATAAPTPTATVLWRQHSWGPGGIDHQTGGVTIPAPAGASATSWIFRYRWHCHGQAYASPEVTYTTDSNPNPIPVVAGAWAPHTHGLRLYQTVPAGTVVHVQWRMDIGVSGQPVGSGGVCGHTFRIMQPSS